MTKALAHRDRDALKETIVGQVYCGRLVAEVERGGAEFAVEIERNRLRGDVVSRLRWHQ